MSPKQIHHRIWLQMRNLSSYFGLCIWMCLWTQHEKLILNLSQISHMPLLFQYKELENTPFACMSMALRLEFGVWVSLNKLMWEEIEIRLLCLLLYQYILVVGLVWEVCCDILRIPLENHFEIKSFWNNNGEVEYRMWVSVLFCMCIWVAFCNCEVG
jgi:hypothetical protein